MGIYGHFSCIGLLYLSKLCFLMTVFDHSCRSSSISMFFYELALDKEGIFELDLCQCKGMFKAPLMFDIEGINVSSF